MANGNFGGGDGSLLSPYLIEDGNDFYEIRNNSTKHFKLANSISLLDCNKVDAEGWVSIPAFSGSLDGQGYIIKNWYNKTAVASTYKNIINTLAGQIRNVGFRGVNVNANGNGTGIVYNMIGESSLIENCYCEGNISNGIYSAGCFVHTQGSGRIRNCYSRINVTSTGRCGGIVYQTKYDVAPKVLPTIENCYYVGNIGSHTNSGGICGYAANPGIINNCFYNANNTTSSLGAYKTDTQMKEASTFTNWTDLDNINLPIWTIIDGKYPELYYNMTDLFLIKINTSYYTLKDNDWIDTNVIGAPTKNDFILHGISGPVLSSITGSKWNELRHHNTINIVSMTNKNKITTNNNLINMVFDKSTVDGHIYKASIDLSLYGNTIKKLFIDRR